jgi:uncharacterized integral membrane protein
MSLRTVALLLILLLFGIFVAVNWAAFTTPTTLSLVAGTVEAPLGVVMLGLTAALAAVFLAYAFYLQSTVLVETRRMAREVEAQRRLADQAEASRFTELRGMLEARLDALAAAARADASRLGDELRLAVQQSANGLAAQLAELDERIGGSRPGGG